MVTDHTSIRHVSHFIDVTEHELPCEIFQSIRTQDAYTDFDLWVPHRSIYQKLRYMV